MKLNCGRFKDWKRKRKSDSIKKSREWHSVFVIYHRLGRYDCRFFEFIERRLVRREQRMYGRMGGSWMVHWDEWEYKPKEK